MIYLVSILVISNLFCNENFSSARISNINSAVITSSELNYIVGHNSQLYSGFRFWFSKNYYIQGYIAPNTKNLKSSVYHQVSVGSVFISRVNYEGIIEIGLNRHRFNIDSYSSWRQFSISSRYKYNPIIIDFILSQLSFDKTNNFLYSISLTYLTSKMHQLSYVISIDELYNPYSSLNFSFNI